jgi:membrane protein implicated in regulation of membrane protease activity
MPDRGLVTLITIVATAGSVKSAILGSHPAAWHLALIHLTINEIAAPIVMVLWAWLAWANSRGYDWARLVFTALFALTTLSLIGALAHHAAVYARARPDRRHCPVARRPGGGRAHLQQEVQPYYRQEPAQR